ncbi:hypothetical protein [Rhodococcus sp. UFZ-B548]|uniref:hypothetical protein n=1 Tax=Rhodococcus sp. UFZ-B548 TaxID=2742212 RepID=UPI0015F735A3|nr:hypothetical protein [Rhodococcus sp. UFZ-B548]
MTESINPNQPLPENVMIVDDNGLPSAVVNIDIVQNAATRLMYDMAINSGDEAALSRVSKKYLDEVGVDLFGYVTAAALKLMTAHILEPLLATCDLAGIKLREGLSKAASDAIRDLT